MKRIPFVGLWLVLVFTLFGSKGFAQIGFTDIAGINGISNYYLGDQGGGVSCADFNGDGLDDLTFATKIGEPIKMYQSTGTGFVEIPPPITDLNEVKQINWVDIDNDGDKDLFLGIYNTTSRLFENDGNFVFTEITSSSGIMIPQNTFGASWGDLNNDGFLDVFVSVRDFTLPSMLFMNNGDNTFANVTPTSGIADTTDFAFCSVLFDYDKDGDLDIYMANDKYYLQNKLFQNDGTGVFTDVSTSSGAGIFIDGMCTTIGDYDNDGDFDLYVSNSPLGNEFLRNNGNGTFTNVAPTNGTQFFGNAWSSQFLDADNDIDLDLYVSGAVGTNVTTSTLFVADGSGNFSTPNILGLEGDTLNSHGNAIGDFNNDGFVDIAVNNMTNNCTVYQNNGNSNNWLKVSLIGTISNRDAIGAEIIASVDGQHYYNFTTCGEGYLGQNSNSEFFGLGPFDTVDSVKINWPSGHVDVIYNVIANQNLIVTEGVGEVINTTLTVEQPSVCGDSTAEIIGLPQYSYLWSTGETTNSISVTNSGQYYAILTNSYGFSISTDTIQVTVQLLEAEVTVSSVPTSCFGSSDGSATLTFDSAPSGTVLWSNGTSGNNLDSVGSGWYGYFATDTYSCFVSDSIYVNSPEQITLSCTSTQETNGNDGSASVYVWGGTAPFTYLWDDPLSQTTQTATNLSGGNYTVQITDANGCVDSVSVTVNSILGLSEQLTNPFLVKPNPTQDYFQIDGPDEIEKLELISSSGSIVQEWITPPKEMKYSVDPIERGIYTLRIYAGHGLVGNIKLVVL